MASGDTKTEAMLNILGNGGSGDEFRGCCNTKTQQYILDAIDRVQNVEDEVEELKNNPDVVDIVDTYADLQAYDTQHLTENDIIRVLQDETHSGNSTYYRFTKNPDTWTFIGEISGGGGGSYTAGDGIDITNDVISATNTGQVRELTTDDYNYPANNPTGVALWLMPAGLYKHASGVNVYATAFFELPYQAIGMVGAPSSIGTPIFIIRQQYDSGGYFVAHYYSVYDANGSYNHEGYIGEPYNKLDSYSSSFPLSANQGRVLNEKIGDLSTLTTTDKTSAVAAINELAQGGGGGGDTVYSSKTTSNSNEGGAVYIGNLNASQEEQPDPTITDSHYKYFWALPYTNAVRPQKDSVNILGQEAGEASISIGTNAICRLGTQVSIGSNSINNYSANLGVAVGYNSKCYSGYSVALGSNAQTSRTGEVNVGTGTSGTGYNSTNYRVIGGVYDGQDAHDAVTVSQVNAVIDAINTALSTNIPHIGA